MLKLNGAQDMKSPTKFGFVFAVLMYGALMSVTFQPEWQGFISKNFPDPVLSLSSPLFFAIVLAILLLPLFLLCPHLMNLMKRSGTRITGIATLMLSLLRRQPDPELRKSQVIVAILSAYFIGLMVAWIVYTSIRGI